MAHLILSIVKNIKSTQSDEYIDRKEYINMLKLEGFQIEIAKKIAKNVKRLDIATDHQPASLAAGSVMLMANILNLNLSKKKISETFKISQVTIIKTFRKIYPYRKVLISNEATEKILKLAKKPLITSEDSETDNIVNQTIDEDEDEEEDDEDDDEDALSIDTFVKEKPSKSNLIDKYI